MDLIDCPIRLKTGTKAQGLYLKEFSQYGDISFKDEGSGVRGYKCGSRRDGENVWDQRIKSRQKLNIRCAQKKINHAVRIQ